MMFWTVVAIAVIFGGLYATRSNVLLYELVEEDSVSGLPIWTLLHPLRDRSPERSAEEILRILQSGRIEEALSKFPWKSADRKSGIMAEEAYHPIQSWKLVSRVDSPGTVELYYSVSRHSKSGKVFSSPMWITLERSASAASWRPVKFDVVY